MTAKATTTHHLVRPSDFRTERMEWGWLEWSVSGPQGTSSQMTTGTCFIRPGQANGRHRHPACDEILIVRSGSIVHTVDDVEFPMSQGDVVSIPAGAVHNARNVGEETAELSICFSSAYRTTEPENPEGSE